MISTQGSLPITDSSFALGLATSASGPPSTFHFANHPANASNAYNVDAGTPVNAAATGAQAASEAAGDFVDPNVAPLSMAWPTGPGQWDFSTTLPSIPTAGN